MTLGCANLTEIFRIESMNLFTSSKRWRCRLSRTWLMAPEEKSLVAERYLSSSCWFHVGFGPAAVEVRTLEPYDEHVDKI